MIINKDFDEFKAIIQNIEKRKILFRGSNFWQRYQLWIYSNEKVIVEDDRVVVPLVSGGSAPYKAEFERNIDGNKIRIKNSRFGAFLFRWMNSYISKRVFSNWDASLS